MHPHDEHVLVVAAVEDPDLAVRRRVAVHPPQVVVGQLLLASGALKLATLHALGVDVPEHVADGAVLAAGVHRLEHHEQLVAAVGVQEVLELLQAASHRTSGGPAAPAVLAAVEVAGVPGDPAGVRSTVAPGPTRNGAVSTEWGPISSLELLAGGAAGPTGLGPALVALEGEARPARR